MQSEIDSSQRTFNTVDYVYKFVLDLVLKTFNQIADLLSLYLYIYYWIRA